MAAAFTLSSPHVLSAQGESDDERYTFTVVNAPKTGLGSDRLSVTITDWSSDADRDNVAAALAGKDSAAIATALSAGARAAGYLGWPGGTEYTLRYARKTTRPDGGVDLTLVTESRVWVWWDAKLDPPRDEPFTVFQVRVDKNGVGEGRMAPASKVKPDKVAGLAIDAQSPVMLTDVRRQRG
jgi:hypothetical protein